MGCSDSLGGGEGGVGAPHQCFLGTAACYLLNTSSHADACYIDAAIASKAAASRRRYEPCAVVCIRELDKANPAGICTGRRKYAVLEAAAAAAAALVVVARR